MTENKLFGLTTALVITVAMAPVAKAEEPLPFGYDATASSQASVTYGPYVRGELGALVPVLSDGYWLPPGENDPRINFDLDGNNTGFAGIAFGFDWQNGVRADVALLRAGDIGFSGPCSSASDGSECDPDPPFPPRPHADISDGTVSSTAMMANLFYAPLEASGSNSRFQPFLVAGIGFSRNTVDSWTRVNPTSPRPVRVFGSDTETEFAWSVGLGASWQLTEPGEWPVLLDMSWRYYDLGTAVGGADVDVGSGIPRQPLTFDLETQVFSIGIRVPLQRL